MSDIPDHDDPESPDHDEDDQGFSTSDFFKRWQDIHEEPEDERIIIDPDPVEFETSLSQELEELCDRVSRLVRHKRKRQDKDEWEELFDRLRRADLWGSGQFDDRVHQELLREFGYDPHSGLLDKKMRRMDKPPIRPKVMRYIFRSLNWRGDNTGRLKAQQRRWLLIRSGVIHEQGRREPQKKRRKNKSNNNAGCFWFIFFVFLVILIFS